MTEQDKSIAHRGEMNGLGQSHFPDGLVPWRPEMAPDLAAGRTTGALRACGYCGSMHPADLARALQAGARASWADFKYGWPHKLYVENVPNPHAGLLESRMGCSHATPVCPRSGQACEHGEQSFSLPKCECMKAGQPERGLHGAQAVFRLRDGYCSRSGEPHYTWRAAGEPAAATTWGKFYTVHLQDASPEDRAIIERAMGLSFVFEAGGRVSWRRVAVAG
jgi:hypothetical protein